jgi:SulP family sulfate permease
LLDAYKAGLFSKTNWIPNIISGLLVGIVALPLAMAFAIASGAQPEQGLYTAIVAGVIVSLFGGSRIQIAGPTGAFIVILSGITAKYGMEGLQIATVMAGFMLLFMGIARFGTVIKFIPTPVILGFTTGIAVVIWVGQWKDFFGLPQITGAHFHEKLWQLIQVLPQLHVNTTLLALFSLSLVIFAPKIPALKRIPGPLIALLAATGLQTYFQLDGVATIGSAFGEIPKGLPAFHIPHFTTDKIIELMGPAFAIALLGAIESLLSAIVADGMAGTKHQSNQELIGQGLANIAAPLFGGFAATGAIARTATNVRNGGNSPLAGVVHAITLILILIFLAPLAVHIPLATLAAILFLVAWNMSELPHVVLLLKRAPIADSVILIITFLLTVFVDLVVAVNLGVILATFHFLRRMASSIDVEELSPIDVKTTYNLHLPPSIMVYTIDGPFFFGATEKFENTLLSINNPPEVLIIQLGWVPFIDITGLQTLEEIIKRLHKNNVVVMLTNANTRVTSKLKKAQLYDLIGRQNISANLTHAIIHAKQLTSD